MVKTAAAPAETTKPKMSSFAGIGLSKEEVCDMIERYGEAWVSQSPSSMAELFCDDGLYLERPGKAIQGTENLKQYWQKTVCQSQSNIEFRHVQEELVFDPEALACTAKWEANFDVHKPMNQRMQLITVVVARFRKCEFGTHKIESMEEYWHNANPRPQNQMNNNMGGGGMMQNNNMGMMGGGAGGQSMNNSMGFGMAIQAPMGMGMGMGMGGMGGNSMDPTCWDFRKGTCRRGDQCKWQHVM